MRFKESVFGVVCAVLVALFLAASLLGCAGMKTCGDTCAVDLSKAVRMSFTPAGAHEPMLQFLAPAGTDNFFAEPYHYAGYKMFVATPLGQVAGYQFAKPLEINGGDGIEAWTLIILTTKNDTGKVVNEVLAIVHTVQLGKKQAERFWLTGSSVTEVDIVEIEKMIETLGTKLGGTGV